MPKSFTPSIYPIDYASYPFSATDAFNEWLSWVIAIAHLDNGIYD
jgi:hypothetical protein